MYSPEGGTPGAFLLDLLNRNTSNSTYLKTSQIHLYLVVWTSKRQDSNSGSLVRRSGTMAIASHGVVPFTSFKFPIIVALQKFKAINRTVVFSNDVDGSYKYEEVGLQCRCLRSINTLRLSFLVDLFFLTCPSSISPRNTRNHPSLSFLTR